MSDAEGKSAPIDPSRSLALRRRVDPEHRVIAVTGPRSFLGAELIAQLEDDRRYLRVLAIDVRKPDLPLTKTQFHRVDLTQPTADAEVAALLKEQGADTLVHLAFLSHPTHNPAWAHELEAIGTMHVLNACSACEIRKVIFGGTTAIYGAHADNPNFLTERHTPKGVSGSRFFEDKLEAERLARRFAAENPATVVTILRPAPILGPRVKNYVSRYLSMPIVPTVMGYDPLVQLTHEQDAAQALKLCVDADFAGEFNIAAPGLLPLSTALAMAGRVPFPVPHSIASPLTKLLWTTQLYDVPPVFLDFLRYLCVVDTSKATEMLGFSPRFDIRQTVMDFAGTAQLHAEAAAPR